MTLFSENTDTCDVCTCTNGCKVTAESSTTEKTVIENCGFNAELACNNGYDAEHCCSIRNIVDKGWKNNTHPNNNSINYKYWTWAEWSYSITDNINNTCALDTADYNENTGKKNDCVIIYFLYIVFNNLFIFLYKYMYILPYKSKMSIKI